MNIFILDKDPVQSAKMYCDKHVPKMIVECYQMLGSSVIRHGATPDMMPLTKKGTPLKGGYHNHPCTRWVGDSRDNFMWVSYHVAVLCEEYNKRFGKEHFCELGLEKLYTMHHLIPEGHLTPFALAMPDEYRPTDVLNELVYHARGDTAVQAYRDYYHSKTFAKWEKTRQAPDWWQGVKA